MSGISNRPSYAHVSQRPTVQSGWLAVVWLASLCLPMSPANAAPSPSPGVHVMKIQLIQQGQVIQATLNNSSSAQDFYQRLPLTLQAEEYAGTEKIAYLPRKLSTDNAPDGYTPTTGDLTYYAPWGNLALFYRDFSYSRGLIALGQLDNPNDAARIKTPAPLLIQAAP